MKGGGRIELELKHEGRRGKEGFVVIIVL